MYAEYFGLKEMPFSIAPNPQYLFMSDRHRDALAHLQYGVHSEGGFILLTGEVGTGKTTLCRCLLEQIPQDIETAFVLNPKVSATELLATICDEFGIAYPKRKTPSVKMLVDKLNAWLLDCHSQHRKAVLIIDEAQNLSRDLLEQLRLLTNLETNERKLLQIILLGQPELLEMLDQQDLRQFSQRITARFHLEALNALETEEYIAHRLRVAGGGRGDLFSRPALRRLYRISRGIPRLINLICDRALLGAWTENRTRITAPIIAKAAKEVLGRGHGTNYGRVYAVAALAVAMVGIIFAFRLLGPLGWPPPETATENGAGLAGESALPFLGHNSLPDAYHDLFALWGVAFEDQVTPPCTLAESIGLQCLRESMNLKKLRLLNRPVIVQFPEGGYMTISGISDSEVTLFASEEEVKLPHRAFVPVWDGAVQMVWRVPPEYQAPLGVGDRGVAVDWLVAQLALIEGSEPPLETGFTYNATLEAQVRKFQQEAGLDPSGIVGPLTWMHINNHINNRVETVNVPLLGDT